MKAKYKNSKNRQGHILQVEYVNEGERFYLATNRNTNIHKLKFDEQETHKRIGNHLFISYKGGPYLIGYSNLFNSDFNNPYNIINLSRCCLIL